jgi:hypothetical protein
MRLVPLPLALALGVAATTATAATPPSQLAELPGTAALPRTPPLAPPQPPLAEVVRLPGTVTAHARVAVGIDAEGTPTKVSVVQRLSVRALGDYAFFIPAPALSVAPAPGSESEPGLRPNQIVWQGFSPRRRLLAAAAELRVGDVDVLPLRIRISGAPTRPGPFELVLTLENTTHTTVRAFTADALEPDVVEALDDLRAAARIGSSLEDRSVRVRGQVSPSTVEVSAALDVRGLVSFPAGAVRDLAPARFSGELGGARRNALRVSIRGVALRPAVPTVRVVAEPAVADTLPPRSARTLEAAIAAYLRYARTRQYETFLANPDPRGPSRTTYVFQTERPSATTPTPSPSTDERALPGAVIVAGLALLGAGLVVLWSHL